MSETTTKQSVIGLYSFPKSGNTWLRAVIAGLTNMPTDSGALQKYVTDSHYGRVLENPWEYQGTEWFFYKSHHKALLTEHKGQEFTTDKIVYIYRHPLDVFVSYLNFISNNVSPQAGVSLGISFDRVEDLTPAQMEKLVSTFIAHGTLFPQNRQFGSIFENIANFRTLQRDVGNVHIVRYEDMIDNFHGEVKKIGEFIGLHDVDSVAAFEDADKRTSQNGKFFWKRQKENFRNFMTKEQIDRFWLVYKDEMESLGYAP